MKSIKMLTSRAGPGYSVARGDVVERHDGEADRLVAAGHAELVDAPEPKPKQKASARPKQKPKEKAVPPAPETPEDD